MNERGTENDKVETVGRIGCFKKTMTGMQIKDRIESTEKLMKS